ncbi:MAG: hypothetical protein QOE11_1039 [Solirubrobacteraceae bacterium]|nr:hypothetical protein [Solirubrobacteraceae bacterium]
MRHRDPLTPDEARELDALERALAGERVAPDLRELEELVYDLRATAPQMSPGFAARLERDVADGFPDPAERPRLRRPRRWVLLPAAGVLAAALIALVVALGQSGSDTPVRGLADSAPAAKPAPAGNSAGGATAQSEAAPQRSATPAPAARDTLTAPAAVAAAPASRPSFAAQPPVAKSSAPRKVQRAAELVLETPEDKVAATSDDVIRTVDRFDGIVASSSIGSDDQAGGEGTFDLRIPTARLDEALAALSKLGHVAERHQSLEDITGSFTSAQDRLSDARAERRGLLRALGRATTKAQLDSLRARLRDVRSTISRLDGDLAALRRRADLSHVSLTVRGVKGSGGGATGSGHWSPGDAARDALRVLEVMAGVALVTLAIAVPLGLLGLAIALTARGLRRRGRERALDPA